MFRISLGRKDFKGAIMYFWQWFWMLSLLIAGSCFFIITVIVVIKGFNDLRVMFSKLMEQHDKS